MGSSASYTFRRSSTVRWLPRLSNGAPASELGLMPTDIEGLGGLTDASETLDDVGARWCKGTRATADEVSAVVLLAAGHSERQVALELGASRGRVRRAWARTRTALLAKAKALGLHPRDRLAMTLALLGEADDVVALALGVDEERVPATLGSIFLRLLRDADPPEAQIRRCWAEDTRRGHRPRRGPVAVG